MESAAPSLAPIQAPPGPKREFSSRGLAQAYRIRELAFELAEKLREASSEEVEEYATRAQALRNLGTVWEASMDRIRIVKGRPLPGSLRPERKPSRRRPRAERLEPTLAQLPTPPPESVAATAPPEPPPDDPGL